MSLGPCNSPSTINLTESWRKDKEGSRIRPREGNFNCDAPMFDNRQWFRFALIFKLNLVTVLMFLKYYLRPILCLITHSCVHHVRIRELWLL